MERKIRIEGMNGLNSFGNEKKQKSKCSGAVKVSPHKKRLRLFFSQSNAHARVNDPPKQGFPGASQLLWSYGHVRKKMM